MKSNKYTITLILFFLISTCSFAQRNENFFKNFLLDSELSNQNKLENYTQYDFSNIWTHAENQNVVGIIGSDHQRIKIKILSVKKNSENPKEYIVFGKSCVKETICIFQGTIKLTEIKTFKQLHYGVDDEYADKGIKSQGILIANYEFKESPDQNHSGVFIGELYSKWFLNSEDQIEYDNIETTADGYTNNAFIGIWKSYKTGKEKICNWADFRVPKANLDFDIGAGEFSPSEKYKDKGWESHQQAWIYGNEAAKKEELEEWWK